MEGGDTPILVQKSTQDFAKFRYALFVGQCTNRAVLKPRVMGDLTIGHFGSGQVMIFGQQRDEGCRKVL